jgi:hypothetical protein
MIMTESYKEKRLPVVWTNSLIHSQKTINGNQSMQISLKREISKYLSVKRDLAKF